MAIGICTCPWTKFEKNLKSRRFGYFTMEVCTICLQKRAPAGLPHHYPPTYSSPRDNVNNASAATIAICLTLLSSQLLQNPPNLMIRGVLKNLLRHWKIIETSSLPLDMHPLNHDIESVSHHVSVCFSAELKTFAKSSHMLYFPSSHFPPFESSSVSLASTYLLVTVASSCPESQRISVALSAIHDRERSE
jgi:hypothetical protein